MNQRRTKRLKALFNEGYSALTGKQRATSWDGFKKAFRDAPPDVRAQLCAASDAAWKRKLEAQRA